MNDDLKQSIHEEYASQGNLDEWVEALVKAERIIQKVMDGVLPGASIGIEPLLELANEMAPKNPVLSSALTYTLRKKAGNTKGFAADETEANRKLLHEQLGRWTLNVLSELARVCSDDGVLHDRLKNGPGLRSILNGLNPQSEWCAKTSGEGATFYNLALTYVKSCKPKWKIEYKFDGKYKESSWEAHLMDEYDNAAITCYGYCALDAYEQLVVKIQDMTRELNNLLLETLPPLPESEEAREKREEVRRGW